MALDLKLHLLGSCPTKAAVAEGTELHSLGDVQIQWERHYLNDQWSCPATTSSSYLGSPLGQWECQVGLQFYSVVHLNSFRSPRKEEQMFWGRISSQAKTEGPGVDLFLLTRFSLRYIQSQMDLAGQMGDQGGSGWRWMYSRSTLRPICLSTCIIMVWLLFFLLLPKLSAVRSQQLLQQTNKLPWILDYWWGLLMEKVRRST